MLALSFSGCKNSGDDSAGDPSQSTVIDKLYPTDDPIDDPSAHAYLYVGGGKAASQNPGTKKAPVATLVEALVIMGALYADKDGWGNRTHGVILIMDDISMGPLTIQGALPDIVIQSGSGNTVLQLNGTGSLITVEAGIKLTLRNITLKGKAANNAALIRVESGGKLVLETGAVIRDNTNYAHLSNPPSTNTAGGGVYVAAGGSFEMTGGEITGNQAWWGGGLYVGGAGDDITITGDAAISGNSVVDDDFMDFYGGGVFLNGSRTIFLSGNAAISGNTVITEGGDRSSYGGGIAISEGRLVMTGNATISGNTAINNDGGSADGGGVCIATNGSIEMTGYARISNNEAECGGGVYLDATSTLIMTGGIIYGANEGEFANTAPEGNGAAVFNAGSASNIKSTSETVYGYGD
jgi:hypothetical protein